MHARLGFLSLWSLGNNSSRWWMISLIDGPSFPFLKRRVRNWPYLKINSCKNICWRHGCQNHDLDRKITRFYNPTSPKHLRSHYRIEKIVRSYVGSYEILPFLPKHKFLGFFFFFFFDGMNFWFWWSFNGFYFSMLWWYGFLFFLENYANVGKWFWGSSKLVIKMKECLSFLNEEFDVGFATF